MPTILDGEFIYNLDNFKNAFDFSLEIDKIKTAIYLTTQIKGETPKHPIIKPLQWNGNINALATLFNELLDSGIITGTKENIKRLLINNFVNDNGRDLSKHYLDEIFKPSKMKVNKKVIETLTPFIDTLKENSPHD